MGGRTERHRPLGAEGGRGLPIQISPFQGGTKQPGTSLGDVGLEGRFLEAIELYKEADIIFREVIAADLDQRSIKAYFLDLAYLFGSYIRRDDGAGAVEVCNEALAQIDILELGNSAEEPIRDLWDGLKERAKRGAIKGNLVERSRKYIRSQWSFLRGDPLASKESAVK
jgi:hypothetical protein